jgi:hypothetical protein
MRKTVSESLNLGTRDTSFKSLNGLGAHPKMARGCHGNLYVQGSDLMYRFGIPFVLDFLTDIYHSSKTVKKMENKYMQ